MAQTFDPYRALGVRRDATEAEVKAAHRRLAKRFHPDAENGDRDRFLRVQEAYKVLSDPLLRREWDARHAPGPIRADRPSPAAPGTAARPRTPRRPARPPRQEQAPRPADGGSRGSDNAEAADEAARRPRSARAYTWSAAEVPWWEEGTSENRRPPGRKRPAWGPAQSAAGPQPPPPQAEPGPGVPNAFDVYNRSSGAAWSRAARAYFRRGDQELPRRGTFQYQGTQVLTGARARTHAEAEARRRAAEPRHEPAAAAAAASGTGAFTYTAAGVSRDANRIHQVREMMRRRASAASWPTLRERLLYALLAWIPAALVIGYGGPLAAGCGGVGNACPAYLETSQALAIALVLGALVALPKVAYVGAMSAVGALLVGVLVVGVMVVWGVELPLSLELTALLCGALAVGYVATTAIVLVRNPSSKPWFTGARS